MEFSQRQDNILQPDLNSTDTPGKGLPLSGSSYSPLVVCTSQCKARNRNNVQHNLSIGG